MPKQCVLIVEDEQSLSDVLAYNLRKTGFDILQAADGQTAINRAQLHLPDLIVLDLMLPVLDGLEVCRQLRGDPRTRVIPILMLTAKSEEVDEVVGFQLGADDYVVKPFKLNALVQRIKALLRRTQSDESGNDVINIRGLEMDRWRHRATVDTRELQLTPTEFRLLWAIARQPGCAFTRHELMDAGLGEDAVAQDRTIDVHVKSIRQKLGGRAELIETVRGVGYRFPE